MLEIVGIYIFILTSHYLHDLNIQPKEKKVIKELVLACLYISYV